MKNTTTARRGLLKAGASVAALSSVGILSGCATSQTAMAPAKKLGRVVVIGGGYGGATAAKYLQEWGGGAIEVVLIERDREFYSCPISNLVLGGVQKIDYIKRGYGGLRERASWCSTMRSPRSIPSSRSSPCARSPTCLTTGSSSRPALTLILVRWLVLMPRPKVVLHSWKAGAQTIALRAQLEAMPDGGVYVLTVPKAPYRCPPGPYERAGQIANYFKREKPRSKVLLLDANPDIQSKKGLFMKVWGSSTRASSPTPPIWWSMNSTSKARRS